MERSTAVPAGIWSFPAGEIRNPRCKRVLDIVFASILMVVLLPIMAVIAVAIKLESQGTVFYRCRRVGQGGSEFNMLKFRKMYTGALGPAVTSAQDDRLTRVGGFLSSAKLDELPQLWNVICGSMSLVGPRPEDPGFVSLYPERFSAILAAKPGMTGLSQLAFANEAELLRGPDPTQTYVDVILPPKLVIDRLYVARRTMIMDLRILAWTALVLVSQSEVAIDRVTARLSVRRRTPLEAIAPEVQI